MKIGEQIQIDGSKTGIVKYVSGSILFVESGEKVLLVSNPDRSEPPSIPRAHKFKVGQVVYYMEVNDFRKRIVLECIEDSERKKRNDCHCEGCNGKMNHSLYYIRNLHSGGEYYHCEYGYISAPTQ